MKVRLNAIQIDLFLEKNFTSLQTPEAESYSRPSQHSAKKNGTPTSAYEKSEKKSESKSLNLF